MGEREFFSSRQDKTQEEDKRQESESDMTRKQGWGMTQAMLGQPMGLPAASAAIPHCYHRRYAPTRHTLSYSLHAAMWAPL
jgi:hypothetical protein